MFAVIGILVVLGAVIGGFLLEHGPIRVLIQPSEILIIGGAALGTLLAANPLHTLKGVIGGILQVSKGVEVQQETISRFAEDDVRHVQQDPPRRPEFGGERY